MYAVAPIRTEVFPDGLVSGSGRFAECLFVVGDRVFGVAAKPGGLGERPAQAERLANVPEDVSPESVQPEDFSLEGLSGKASLKKRSSDSRVTLGRFW